MEERTLFKTWLLFLFLGLSFHLVFYFHDRSTILNISYWVFLLFTLIIFQSFINNPIRNSRYPLIIYPIITGITFYLLKNIISPYIHFNVDDFFYFFEYKKMYSDYIIYINSYLDKLNAFMLFSITTLFFYVSLIFFIFYYLVATPITTLRRVYNGLFSLISLILLINCLFPTTHVISLAETNDSIVIFNNFLISYTNIKNLSLISFETSISLFIGLTVFRTNRIIGAIYIAFIPLIIGALLYFKITYITDIILSIILTLFVFFKINKGFTHNKTTFNI